MRTFATDKKHREKKLLRKIRMNVEKYPRGVYGRLKNSPARKEHEVTAETKLTQQAGQYERHPMLKVTLLNEFHDFKMNIE